MTIQRGVLYEISTGGILYEISSKGVLYDNTGSYKITRDDYYTRNQPAKSEELKNRVLVKYAPLYPGESAEVYRSPEAISLDVGGSVVIEAEYNNLPCVDATADLDNIAGSTFSIDPAYYSWGVIATVTNTGALAGTCEMFIEAIPLVADAGENYSIAEDDSSIAENGVLEYKFPDCHLIQTAAVAESIASALISSYATPRKDVSISWRGDPALELGDEISVPIYHRLPAAAIMGNFYAFKNKLDFDGTLKMQTEGRKI